MSFYCNFAKNYENRHKTEMILPPHIQAPMKRKSGLDLRTPSEVELLCMDIETQTNELRAVNTLKRLLELIKDERAPRTSTLDIISKYLGFDNWDVLQKSCAENTDIQEIEHLIKGCRFYIGEIFQIKYRKDRHITLKFKGDNTFTILKSSDQQLEEGTDIKLMVV